MGTSYAAGVAADVAGGLFGGQQDPVLGNAHLANQGQADLWNSMFRGRQSGAGDFGFGSNFKLGKSQVQNFIASRGGKLDPSSGAYAGAMGNMTGQALGMDAQARNDYTMNLLRSPMQMFQTTGANFMPDSPSRGFDANRQYKKYRRSIYGDAAIDAKDNPSRQIAGAGRTG